MSSPDPLSKHFSSDLTFSPDPLSNKYNHDQISSIERSCATIDFTPNKEKLSTSDLSGSIGNIPMTQTDLKQTYNSTEQSHSTDNEIIDETGTHSSLATRAPIKSMDKYKQKSNGSKNKGIIINGMNKDTMGDTVDRTITLTKSISRIKSSDSMCVDIPHCSPLKAQYLSTRRSSDNLMNSYQNDCEKENHIANNNSNNNNHPHNNNIDIFNSNMNVDNKNPTVPFKMVPQCPDKQKERNILRPRPPLLSKQMNTSNASNINAGLRSGPKNTALTSVSTSIKSRYATVCSGIVKSVIGGMADVASSLISPSKAPSSSRPYQMSPPHSMASPGREVFSAENDVLVSNYHEHVSHVGLDTYTLVSNEEDSNYPNLSSVEYEVADKNRSKVEILFLHENPICNSQPMNTVHNDDLENYNDDVRVYTYVAKVDPTKLPDASPDSIACNEVFSPPMVPGDDSSCQRQPSRAAINSHEDDFTPGNVGVGLAIYVEGLVPPTDVPCEPKNDNNNDSLHTVGSHISELGRDGKLLPISPSTGQHKQSSSNASNSASGTNGGNSAVGYSICDSTAMSSNNVSPVSLSGTINRFGWPVNGLPAVNSTSLLSMTDNSNDNINNNQTLRQRREVTLNLGSTLVPLDASITPQANVLPSNAIGRVDRKSPTGVYGTMTMTATEVNKSLTALNADSDNESEPTVESLGMNSMNGGVGYGLQPLQPIRPIVPCADDTSIIVTDEFRPRNVLGVNNTSVSGTTSMGSTSSMRLRRIKVPAPMNSMASSNPPLRTQKDMETSYVESKNLTIHIAHSSYFYHIVLYIHMNITILIYPIYIYISILSFSRYLSLI